MNLFKIASRLKYAYLNDAEAQRRGVDMGKFAHLKKIKDKVENIFYQAGGKTDALKLAILKGHGNKNHDVMAGLGYAPENLPGIDASTPLSKLLGQSYNDEVSGFEGMGGLGELGEPATAAAITAASGAMAAIAGLLSQVGNIFPKKSKGSKDFVNAESGAQANAETNANANTGANTNAPAANESTSEPAANTNTANTGTENSSADSGKSSSTSAANNNSGDGSNESAASATAEETQNSGEENSNVPATTNSNSSDADNSAGAAARGMSKLPAVNDKGAQTFWQKNKKWILPSGIGLAVVLISIGGYIALKKPKAENKQPAIPQAVSGVPRSRKKKKSKKKGSVKPKIKSKKKSVVAFI
jgi:hypothetical protein